MTIMRMTHECPVQATSEVPKSIGWLPLVALGASGVLVREFFPPWVFMWIMAGALWVGCKWMVLWREINIRGLPTFPRTLAFFLLWPGMDADAFLREPTHKRTLRWEPGFGKMVIGAALLWIIAPRMANDLIKGWIGMLGLILLLHFGLFHLIAVVWQRNGVDAEPLMRSPATATSLADFWSHRWNTAFNQLAFQLVFRPTARRIGSRLALLATFLVSGLTHELVITVPARGGCGLPTAYFLCQGAGVLLENSTIGKRLNLRRGFCGWLFTALIAAGPAYFLFPPPFVRNVMLPMFEALNPLHL